jgi:hypothetical protein
MGIHKTMAIPLLWIGAAAVATYAGVKYGDRLEQSRGAVKHFPGQSDVPVTPVSGSIVSCEVFGALEHTGIWVDDYIIELNGSGLVRSVSPTRFLKDRSGCHIYVACIDGYTPIGHADTAHRAITQLYTYRPYDVLHNNCHHFVWEMLDQSGHRVGRFSQLNQQLAHKYGQPVSWHPLAD